MNIIAEQNIVTAINLLAEEINRLSSSKGFWDTGISDETIVTKLALIHTEVAEATEEVRKDFSYDDRIEALGEEIADVVIRALDLSAGLKLDIGNIILRKHNANATRPYRHGKRF